MLHLAKYIWVCHTLSILEINQIFLTIEDDSGQLGIMLNIMISFNSSLLRIDLVVVSRFENSQENFISRFKIE